MTSVHQQGRRDPHDVLGVSRGADRQQVIQAFHRRARRGGHPDTGGDAQTFAEIVRARDVLLERASLDAATAGRRESQPDVSPHRDPRRADAAPRETTRQARPAGQRSGSVVPFVLFILCVFALPVLLRILSVIFIP